DDAREACPENAALAQIGIADGGAARGARIVRRRGRIAMILRHRPDQQPLMREEADVGAVEAAALQLGNRGLQLLGILEAGDGLADDRTVRTCHGRSPLAEKTSAPGEGFSPADDRTKRVCWPAALLRRWRSAPAIPWRRRLHRGRHGRAS